MCCTISVLHVAVGFLSLASADHYPCNAVGNNIVDFIISVLLGVLFQFGEAV